MTGTPEFLEREMQMSHLLDAFDAAARGAGRLVAIEGEAGIGKTTLVQRFADARRASARVYRGGCEHLLTPEPLSALRDIARQSQGRFAFAAGSDGVATFDALLRMLAGGPGPALLVLEDLHWADAPTLDFVRYLGRRIAQMPVLALVTVRTDASAAHEQVAAVWPEIPRDNFERMALDPLSLAAVSRLAAAAGRRADELYAATRGNPFFVTEALAAPADATPATVRDATLLRTRCLSAPAAQLLEAASIFPRQVEYETLAGIANASDEATDECMRAGMLEERHGMLAFRHELARRVIEESLPPRRRRSMHGQALAVLRGRAGAGAARLAHHAEHAGDVDTLVEIGSRAAEEASALGAHREATAQLARVLRHASGIADAERAGILERHATEGELSGDAAAAARSIEEACALRRRGHDTLGLGNALRIASRVHWQLGDRTLAEREGAQAIEVLGAHSQSWQLAMALSNQSQLDMLADRFEKAIDGGGRAMRLAETLGRWDIYLHAWTNVASAISSLDPRRGYAELLDAIHVADERGLPDYIPRLYVNLCYTEAHSRHYDALYEHLEDGIARSIERDNAPLECYLRGVRAAALLDRGRLQEANDEAERALAQTSLAAIPRFPAVVALSRVRARRGLPGAAELLAEARTLTAAAREPQRYTPLAVADAEAHWLGETRPHAVEQLRHAYAELTATRARTWMIAEVALWLHVLGVEFELYRDLRSPLLPAHALHIAGRWREAADAWRALGCPFEEALALREGDEAAQREALALFERIGAAAAAQRLRREMRAHGVRSVPAGPRAATRGNPAGLTSRQMQVLALMAAGLDNAAIGARLHISAKTAEHHVGAVLAALGATTRQRAVEAARARGLLADDEES